MPRCRQASAGVVLMVHLMLAMLTCCESDFGQRRPESNHKSARDLFSAMSLFTLTVTSRQLISSRMFSSLVACSHVATGVVQSLNSLLCHGASPAACSNAQAPQHLTPTLAAVPARSPCCARWPAPPLTPRAQAPQQSHSYSRSISGS